MAVRIRLARRGRKARALYDIVVADGRAPRDGRFIEKLGYYNPNTDPATINLNDDKALEWIMKGAQPSDTARAILSHNGVMMRKHLQVGVNKGAITQEEADKRFSKWVSDKEGKVLAKVEGLQKATDADLKARFEAETKVKEARIEKLAQRQAELNAAETAAEAEANTEEAVEESDAAEAPAAEAPVADAPVAEEAVAVEAVAEEVAEETVVEAVAEEVATDEVVETAVEAVAEEAAAEEVVEAVAEEVVEEAVVEEKAEEAAEKIVEEVVAEEKAEEAAEPKAADKAPKEEKK